jgi:UDP-N-acetylmuramoylalanine--D-glutamate ligase
MAWTYPPASSQISVFGAGRSGRAVAGLLSRMGLSVFVSDTDELDAQTRVEFEQSGIGFEEGGHSPRAEEADFIVVSPGVKDSSLIMHRVLTRGIPCYSEIEVASWYCSSPIVAITGSNGKTTTTLLTGSIFDRAGIKTWIAGNIGTPFAGIADRTADGDVVVLEVSSFQLDHIDRFRPDVAVLTNITPDHLDRYDNSMEHYANSKKRIFANQGPADTLVYNLEDDRIAECLPTGKASGGPRLLGFSTEDTSGAAGFIRDDTLYLNTEQTDEVLMQKSELALRGRHNASNALAAAVAARVMEVRTEDVRNSLASFEGVPHRLEFVREVDGVEYINDSKATNVNAVWYALESYSQPVVLIAGGRDKGNDYSELCELVSNRVRVLISVGEAASAIDSQLGPHVDQRVLAESMEDAVRYAALLSRAGEVVLLSPGCASFDMFENFEHRGDTFKHLVSNL